MRRGRQNSRGFTLIEMMIVISLILILISIIPIVVFVWNSFQEGAT